MVNEAHPPPVEPPVDASAPVAATPPVGGPAPAVGGPAAAVGEPASAVGEPGTAAPALPVSSPRRARRLRRVLLVAVIFVGIVASVAGTIGFIVYDKVTAIDRSTPTIAVRNYLQTALVDRDVNRISLFVCTKWAPSDAMAAVGDKPDASMRINWGVTAVQEAGDQAQATARITFTSQGYSDIQTWNFTVVREDGWRVCAVQRGDSLHP